MAVSPLCRAVVGGHGHFYTYRVLQCDVKLRPSFAAAEAGMAHLVPFGFDFSGRLR